MLVRNNRISTSGLKSDVAIMFFDPDFLKDAKILAIRIHLRQIYNYLIFAWIFRTSWSKIGILGQNGGRDGAILTHNRLLFTFGCSYICANFGENRSRNATVRVLADGHTDRRKPIL